MDVLKIVAVLLGVFLLGSAIFKYDQFIQSIYLRTIFNVGIVFAFTIIECSIFFTYSWKEKLGTDNFIVLLVILALLIIAFVISNINTFGYLHGIIITQLQFIAAFVILIITIFVFVFVSDSKGKRRKRK